MVRLASASTALARCGVGKLWFSFSLNPHSRFSLVPSSGGAGGGCGWVEHRSDSWFSAALWLWGFGTLLGPEETPAWWWLFFLVLLAWTV